ncbi:MAG TPA: hypothetical protein VG096_11240 [Bryobacteraceae bacterium]|jgi:hypothetical protein|nr:hypothetical protein [Bryobacteraceae bacterium]
MSREPERVRYPARIVVGIAVAILLCLWGVFQSYAFESEYQRQSPDPYQISAQFMRLAPVLSTLPENTVLGYVTDAEAGSTSDSALLASAEYVLAPRLLTRGTNHDWVLGNFTRPADFAAFGKSLGLRMQQDCGNGVVLYRKEHQP